MIAFLFAQGIENPLVTEKNDTELIGTEWKMPLALFDFWIQTCILN